MKTYPPTERCGKCQGKCCRHLPGIAYPDDIVPLTETHLVELLVSGKWQIDWWDNHDEPEEHFLRPATTNSQDVFNPSWGGVCVFLTPTGCVLDLDHRPTACRLLEPRPGDEPCIDHTNGKRGGVDAWKPHEVMLLAAGRVAEETT